MVLRFKNLILFAVIVMVAIFSSVKPVQAFGISPIKILLTVDQNSSQTVVVKISNSSANAQETTFKLSVFGTRQDEAGLPVFERGIDVAENWVYPEINLVKLKAGETKSVNFIIKIPEDANPGSRYLGLAVEPSQENNKTGVSARLLSLLTLQVKGLVSESLVIENWDLQTGPVGNDLWKFDLRLKNSGTIEVPVQAEVGIKNWQGEEIFSEPLVLGNKLLANSKRELSPEILLKNNISLPGLYQVQLRVVYGKTNQSASAIAYIWYLPLWSKILACVLGFGLVALSFFLIKRKR